MKNVFKKIFKIIGCILPRWALKNYIVFESVPDCSDNTRAVFDEMIKRGLNKQYKLIWLIKNEKHKITGIKNVKCVLTQNFIKHWYIIFAKCLISCNQKLSSYNKGQYSIYLDHGAPLKSVRCQAPATPVEDICNWLATSEHIKEVVAYEYNMPMENGVGLGYPRNDEFYKERVDLQNLFDIPFKKIVVWYPTFRQNPGGISASDSNIALPIINNERNAILLNKFAEKNEILIVLKPHFAQDINYLLNLNLPYIRFIDDEFLFDNHISSYQFVNGCDALLTDYSSIYHDFLITNRPIGLTWEDYENYAKRPGFAIDMDYYMAGGEKIYNVDDLLCFLSNVICEKDSLVEKKREICGLIHQYCDGRSAERVVDYILRHINS